MAALAMVIGQLVAQLEAEDNLTGPLRQVESDLKRVDTQTRQTGATTRQTTSTMAAAYNRSQAAATRLSLAEQALAQAKRSGNASTQQLMQLEARVASARASSISASSRYASTQRQVAAAHQQSSVSADRHAKSTTTLNTSLMRARSLMATMGVGFSAMAVTRFFTNTVNAAREAEAIGLRVENTFGAAGAAISEWAQSTANDLRMSEDAAKSAALQFSSFGLAIGKSDSDLATFSTGLTELAADLAAYGDYDMSQVVEDMGSALSGQQEPMRKYGVLLDQARLQEIAFANNITESNRQLTQQERVLATQAALHQELSYAVGANEDAQGTYGDSVRNLQADFQNLQAEIGAKLMPIAQGFVDLLTGPGMAALSGFGGALGVIGDLVGTLSSAFGSLPGPVQTALGAVVAFRIAQRLLGTQMGTLGARIGIAGTSFRNFGTQVSNVQRAATITGRSMGPVRAGIVAVGRSATGASPMLTNMRIAFLNARSAATTMPSVMGAAAAGITGVRTAASGLMGALGGPWGLAITGATALLATWINRKQKDAEASREAEDRTNDWAEALNDSGGAITQNIRDMATKQLSERGMLDDLDKLGVSEKEVADAVLFRGEAYDQLWAKVERIRNTTSLNDEDGENLIQTSSALLVGMREMSEQMAEGETRAMQMARASGDLTESLDGSSVAAGAMSEAMTEFDESTDGAASKVDKLSKALNELYGDEFTVEDAAIDWAESMDAFAETLGETGTAAVDAAGNFDLTTEAGRKLFESTRDIGESMRGTAAAAFNDARNSGMGLAESLAFTRDRLNEQRQSWIDNAVAGGMTRDMAEQVANQMGLIPDEIISKLNVEGLENALNDLQALGIEASREFEANLAVTDNTPEVRAKLDQLGVDYEIIDGEVVIGDNTPEVQSALAEIGVTTRSLPGGWVQIDDSSDENIARMRDLGIEVGRLPDGSIFIDADDAEFWAVVERAKETERKRIIIEAAREHIDRTGHGVPYRQEYIDEASGNYRGGRLPKHAVGGRLPTSGPGTERRDGIYGIDRRGRGVAMLDGGEWVINADSSARYNDELRAINEDRLPKLAEGGVASESEAASAAPTPPSGEEAGASALSMGLGLGQNLEGLAQQVLDVKSGQLDPAMEGLTQGVATYGLTTEQQTANAVSQWQSMAAQIKTEADSTITPTLAALRASMQDTGTAIMGTVSQRINPATSSIGDTVALVQAGTVDPMLSAMRGAVDSTAATFVRDVDGRINPASVSVGDTVRSVHTGTIDPVMADTRAAVDNTAASFGTGAAAIGTQWNQVREGTAAPVRWTIGQVFNDGLVGMWNSVSEMVGTDTMNPYPVRFADGGVLPGYTPGRDVHHFASPTGGRLALSGGEAIMRPEWTQAVGGPAEVDRMNSMARSGQYRRVPGTDQYLGGDMAFAAGGTIQGGAEITSEIQRTMWDAVRTAFPNVVLTSGTRYADVGSGFDNHMGERAIDLGGPMPEISRWIYQMNRAQPVEELIHAPLQGWQNLKSGQPLNYGAATDADHYDHVHWAMANMVNNAGKLVSMAAGSGGGPAMVKSMAQVIDETLAPMRSRIEEQIASTSFGGKVGQLPRAVYAKLHDAMTAKLQDLATKYMGPDIGGGGDVERWRPMVIAALKRNGFEPSKRNQDLMLSQIQSESSGDPSAIQQVQDINSGGNEAAGLLQVIPGTFQTHRDPSLPDDRTDPWANMNAALRYYRATYGEDLSTNWGRGVGYNQGGTVGGSGNRDTEHAVLTPGEEVIRKDKAEKYRPLLKAINEDDNEGSPSDGIRVFVTNWPSTGVAEPSSVAYSPSTVPPANPGGEDEMAGAKNRHAEATERVTEAEQTLAAVREDPDATDEQKMEAEQALEDAKRQVTETTDEQRTAEERLQSTQQQGAEQQEDIAFEMRLRNPLQPFWWRGEKEHRERIIAEHEEQQRSQQATTTANDGQQELETAEVELAAAQADLEEAQADGVEAEIEQATAAVERAQEAVDQAKQRLNPVARLWTGGTVPGRGNTDSVHIMATPGEEVTRKQMATKHRALLKAINQDQVQYHANGGSVGFGGYSADDSDYMKPTSLQDYLALGVGGVSSIASMAAPYAQMALTGQVDLGNMTPVLDTGANDPSGGFATQIVGDYASQITQQLAELIRAVKEGKDVRVIVENDQSPSAASMVGMGMGV